MSTIEYNTIERNYLKKWIKGVATWPTILDAVDTTKYKTMHHNTYIFIRILSFEVHFTEGGANNHIQGPKSVAIRKKPWQIPA